MKKQFKRLARTLALGGLATAATLGLSGCDEGVLQKVFELCPQVDLVFVMDTSGSMDDEAEALCGIIADVESELEALGAELQVTILGITEDADDDSDFPCLTDNVADLLGTPVPGVDDQIDDTEDWGPAVAVVAARFPWIAGALRVVVPISDEDPQDGNSCFDPGSDRDAIDNAIVQANANDVTVSPILANQADADEDDLTCVEPLMNALADATDGEVNTSLEPGDDLADAINSLIRAACEFVAGN